MVSFDNLNTFMASSTEFSAGTAPTDVFTISGNATTNVYVLRMGISTTQTTAGSNAWYVVKRSTANAGGTHASPTVVPFNSNATAGAATILQYTVNATTGTLVGKLWSGHLNSVAPATAGIGGYDGVVIDFLSPMSQPIALLSAAETLAWNFGGASLPVGMSVLAWVLWAESSKT